MKKTLDFLLLAAAAGLAAPASAQTGQPPIVTKSGSVGDAPAGKAQVVFWRPGTIIGGALGCTVREGEGANEVEVARLGAGKYWVHVAEPGKHVYFTKGEATDRLNMELEPDETYFVRCNIGMGVMSGRAQVSPSDRATFAGKAKKMKLWEPKEEKKK